MEHKNIEHADTREIFIRLEMFDDIFSDFDIRPYSKRALSVDFLDEIRRASNDKDMGGIELTLYVPEKERSESNEETIRERLGAHFRRHHDLLTEAKKDVIKLGWGMSLLGVIAMIIATSIKFSNGSHNIFLSFFEVFLEPAGLFMLWEGMELVIFKAKDKNPELHFYRKMSDSRGNIHFKSY